MSDFSVCVIIAAAGKSARFGSGDKLSQDLGGRPLLLRTVEPFTKHDDVKSIIVAAPPESMEEFRQRFGAQLGFHGVTIVAGGVLERWESIRNALVHVPESCTHVAIHDAARPCLSESLLKRVIDAARVADAVVPAVPAVNTLRRVGEERFRAAPDDEIAEAILGGAGRTATEGHRVEATIPRARVVECQTPQIFSIALLRRAYAQEQLSGATDDAMLVERLGEPVLIIEGDRSNMKVTDPEDLVMIRLLMGMRPPQDRAAHKRF
ncbi:MAG: 2-C-methyl-D-erythritol 4-phosphate cytidylyltransferase [Phycisphaerales bacterium]|nr:2-C-methyl-D-erythritol 4-phosphate cytidylyltransferase [Phycisphaerales bacterium]